LNAIIGDLFSDQIIFAEELILADLEKSHYGFPIEAADYYAYIDRNIP